MAQYGLFAKTRLLKGEPAALYRLTFYTVPKNLAWRIWEDYMSETPSSPELLTLREKLGTNVDKFRENLEIVNNPNDFQ